MKRLLSLSLIPFAFAFAMAVKPAHAGPVQIEVPTNIEPAVSGLTRAEVVADFHLWRLVGLHDLHNSERSVDTGSYQYRKAYATYLHLRNSPQYAALVRELEKNPNANVVAARSTGASAQAAAK